MTPPLGAGKQSKLMAISVVPSFNYVNSKRTRVRGFTLVQTLDNAEGSAEKTTFNGQPAYLLDQTIQPTCTGDEAGWAGGVKSGTVGGEVKPTSGSPSVLVEGKQLVCEGNCCLMNYGNTVGKYFNIGLHFYKSYINGPKHSRKKKKKDNVDVIPDMTDEEIEEKVRKISGRYKKMISAARYLGKDFAADNLQRFLDGTGGTKELPSDFIKSYLVVRSGENRIRDYVKDRQLQEMSGVYHQDSEVILSEDTWDANTSSYNPLSELTYASGGSIIKTKVNIRLKSNKNTSTYIGSGEVKATWQDTYNWNEGDAFFIPSSGGGEVSDDDGIFLKEHGGAADFELRSYWTLKFEGEYNPETKRWVSFKWKD